MNHRSRTRLSAALGLIVVVAIAAVAFVSSAGALGVKVAPAARSSASARSAATARATSRAHALAESRGLLGPGLAALARRHPLRAVSVIVQLRDETSAAQQSVLASGGSMQAELPLIHGFAAQLPARAAVGLAGLPSVRVVSLNAEVQGTGGPVPGATPAAPTAATPPAAPTAATPPAAPSNSSAPPSTPSGAPTAASNTSETSAYTASVQAPQAWQHGATGYGVGVAVIDTGVAGNLPDFQEWPGNSQSRVIVSAVVNPEAQDATDTYGHGTHVAGIIAGDGWNLGAGNPDDGKYVGVAPLANIISVKADDGQGHTTVLDLIDGLQFVVDHQQQYNIRVVNLSVRSTTAQSYTTDPLDAAVEQAWLNGIVVVAAAGNLGTSSDAVDYAPANDPFVLTVGAVDDQGTPGTGDDVVASWSSSGVTQDGFAKPDVLAPGAHVVSTLAPGSEFAALCPTCVVDGSYFKAGGTSMAAAVASGAVADILTVHPGWSPDQVKAALVADTRPVPSAGHGIGEIDVNKVVQRNKPPAPADQGLTTNQFVNPATGDIVDQTGSWATGSWGTGSWGTGSWAGGAWTAATGQWVAPWAQASYTGAPLDPNGFTPVPPDCIQLERSNWTTGSWATGSWSTDQLNSALAACQTAASQTGSWGTGSWGTGSWGTGSWGTGSWGTGSWGTGSWSTGSWSTGSWSTSFDQ